MAAAVMDAIDSHVRRSQSVFGELAAAPLLPSAFSGGFTVDTAMPTPMLATATIHSLATTVSTLIRRVARLEATCVVLEGKAVGAAIARGASAGGIDPMVVSDAIAAAMRPIQDIVAGHDRAIQQIARHVADHQRRYDAVVGAAANRTPVSDPHRRDQPSAHFETAENASGIVRLKQALRDLDDTTQTHRTASSHPHTAESAPETHVYPSDGRSSLVQRGSRIPDSRQRTAPAESDTRSSSSPWSGGERGARGGGGGGATSSSAEEHRGGVRYDLVPVPTGTSSTTPSSGDTGAAAANRQPQRYHHHRDDNEPLTTERAVRLLWEQGHLRRHASHDESTRIGDSRLVVDTSHVSTHGTGGGVGTSFELSQWAGTLLQNFTIGTEDNDRSRSTAVSTATPGDVFDVAHPRSGVFAQVRDILSGGD
jgi:hypothetical protein